MEKEFRCKIELEEFSLDEKIVKSEAAIGEKTEEENAIEKNGKNVNVKQEPEKTEFVAIKQEPLFSENEDYQTNTENPPDPLSLHEINLPIEIDENPNKDDTEPNKIGKQTGINDKKEKLLQCKYCEKKFAQSIHKKEHERIHTGEKPHVCQFCGAKFTKKANKNRHVQKHIFEKKDFKCQFCEKKFAEKSSKDTHERIHTGEKPFKCQFCERKFRSSSEKVIHERLHTGEKPYKCQFCEKKFTRSGEKLDHERVHTGEKPYKCQFCEKMFARSSAKLVHQRRIHTRPVQNHTRPVQNHTTTVEKKTLRFILPKP